MQKFIDHEGTIAFGKHKSQPLSVLLADTEYVKWLVHTARQIELEESENAPFAKFVKRYVLMIRNKPVASGKKRDFEQLQQACINAVSSQIGMVRSQYPSFICEKCRTLCSVQYHTDTTVHSLIEAFMKDRTNMPVSFDKLSDAFGVRRTCFEPEDHLLQQEWQEYHMKHARYVLTCECLTKQLKATDTEQ
jgi:hypothetical protein